MTGAVHWPERDLEEIQGEHLLIHALDGERLREESKPGVHEILEKVAIGICVLDGKARIQYINSTGARVFGSEPEALRGRRVESLAWGELAGRPAGTLRQALLAGELAYCEPLRQRAGGTTAILALHAARLPSAGEKSSGMVLSFTDITAAKRVEEELRSRQRHMDLVVESAPVVLFSYDTAGTIMVSEGRAKRRLGGLPAVGANVFEFYAEEPGLIAQIQRSLEGKAFDARVHVEFADADFDVHYEPVHDEQGELAAVIGVAVDATETLQATEGLHRSLKALRQTQKERWELLHQLVHAHEMQRARIAADIHDDSVQVMFAAALRLARLRSRLKRQEQLALVDDVTETIELAIARLRHLVFELRSEILEAGNAAAILGACLKQLHQEAGIGYALDATTEMQLSPPAQLAFYQIVREALNNVARHAAASRIEASIQAVNAGVLVRIKDDGVGFKPDSDRRRRGHLGLVAMRERANLAGGWWELESKPAAGTSVRFWLPAIAAGESAR